MTTHSNPAHDDISRILAAALPAWCSQLQRDTLVDRFFGGYDYGWITGDGYSAGGANSERGASRAARRAASRAARPAPWTHVINMAKVVERNG